MGNWPSGQYTREDILEVRVKLEAWKSVAFSRHVRFSSCFLWLQPVCVCVCVCVCVFLVLHTGWQTVGTQEMLDYLSYCWVRRNFQEKVELQCPRKPCIDKPPGMMWPLYLQDSLTYPRFVWWVFKLQETDIFLPFSVASFPQVIAGWWDKSVPPQEGRQRKP